MSYAYFCALGVLSWALRYAKQGIWFFNVFFNPDSNPVSLVPPEFHVNKAFFNIRFLIHCWKKKFLAKEVDSSRTASPFLGCSLYTFWIQTSHGDEDLSPSDKLPLGLGLQFRELQSPQLQGQWHSERASQQDAINANPTLFNLCQDGDLDFWPSVKLPFG